MWELQTRGCTPYPDVEAFDMQTYLLCGNRMDRPDFAPEEMYVSSSGCANLTMWLSLVLFWRYTIIILLRDRKMVFLLITNHLFHACQQNVDFYVNLIISTSKHYVIMFQSHSC